VVVVCSAGYASSLAAASLADLGFTAAADLDGGYQAWRTWAAASGPDAETSG
jgi:rhodanese-related sulfurtransferase